MATETVPEEAVLLPPEELKGYNNESTMRTTKFKGNDIPLTLVAKPFADFEDSCLRKVFSLLFSKHNPHLTDLELQELHLICENMDLEDVGCALNPQYLWAVMPDTCVWTNIFESNEFSVNIFHLPKDMIIPIHDHPDMTGINFVLHGSIEYTSYTVTKPDEAVLCNRVVTTPDMRAILTHKKEGNLHTLLAFEDSSVFQVLTPSYNDEHRACSFYSVTHIEADRYHLSQNNDDETIGNYNCRCANLEYSGIPVSDIFSYIESTTDYRPTADSVLAKAKYIDSVVEKDIRFNGADNQG